MKPRRSARVRPRRKSGSALLEAVVSLIVLGMSGVGLISLMGQSAHSLREVRRAELETRRASTELDRIAIFDRTQLLGLSGTGREHGWLVSVRPSTPDLFDVSVADPLSGVTIVRTTLYRPDTLDATTP